MPRDSRSDEALIEAADRGEVAAFETLYRRHRDWVVRLAFRFTRDHDDALDVMQETFSYLLGKFPGFRLTAKLTTFLYPVVKNLSITVLCRRGRDVNDDDLLKDVPAPSADEANSMRAELASALVNLAGPQREVLLMRYVDDMSINEIARALEIPPGTVKSRLHNALVFLKDDERTQEYFLD